MITIRSKLHFQLLEVLIACTLVIVAIPFLSMFVNIHVEQRKFEEEIELHHVLHLTHVKIIESLYTQGAQAANLQEILNKKKEIILENGENYPYIFEYLITINRGPVEKNEKWLKYELLIVIDAFRRNDSSKRSLLKHSYLAYVEEQRDSKSEEEKKMVQEDEDIDADEEEL